MSAQHEVDTIRQCRTIVSDLFEHNALIYWTDMLVSLAIGYTGAAIYLDAPAFSLVGVLAYFVGGFALFRVGSYIHEIVHLSGNQLKRFRFGWNLLAGIPMLMPSFFYENHIDHHSSKHYGTGQDGEYLPLGIAPPHAILEFFAQVMVLPLLVLFRFLILTPVSFLHPRLRQWTLEHATSYVINFRYQRRIPANAPRKTWALIEWLCFFRAAAMIAAPLLGLMPFSRWPKLYVFAVMVLGLNYVRNLVAHHYRNPGQPISHFDQLVDSVNITGMPIVTELFFPLSLRYHALHHLLPSMPYHNLAKAHRRLMAELPAESPYRDTVYPGYWAVVRELVRDARRAQQNPPPQSREWYARRREIISGVAAAKTTGQGVPDDHVRPDRNPRPTEPAAT